MEEKTYEAVLMSAGSDKFNKGGFKTEEEAWDYIYSQSCDGCKEFREQKDGFDACAAEWDVFEEKN